MKVDIKVPAMGESISEATIGQILKPSGSSVAAEDEIIELETEKVNQVLYASQAGVVNWSVKKGDTVKIGQTIGDINSEGKVQKATAPAEAPAPKAEAPKKEEKRPPEPAPQPGKQGARVSKEAFVADITSEKKAMPTPVMPPPQPKKQQPAAAKSESSKNRNETRKPMSKIRQVIAKRLVEAKQTTAMLTTFNEIDMTQVLAERELYKEKFLKQYGVRLGFMSFFVKAVVAALEQFPDLNSYIDGDEIVHREYYDISIAVSTDRGLVVPVVRNCDRLSFAEIEHAIENYAKKARDNQLSVDDLQGGGFTITNGGVYGSLLSTPILNPPQCGILGMHKIAKRPVVINDEIVIRSMMYVALSYDHRLVDGKEAVSFLVTIKNFLEDPARLVLNI